MLMNATLDNPEVKNVVYSIVESMVDRELRMNPLLVPEGNLDTTTALIYDSVNAFAIALHQLTSVQQVDRQKSSCLIKAQNVIFLICIVIVDRFTRTRWTATRSRPGCTATP